MWANCDANRDRRVQLQAANFGTELRMSFNGFRFQDTLMSLQDDRLVQGRSS